MRIYKYKLALGHNTVNMPKNAIILKFEVQDADPMIWCIVDPDEVTAAFRFDVLGTGDKVNDQHTYIGTGFSYPYVWHCFRVGR